MTDSDPLLLLGIELDIKFDNNGTERTYHSLLIFNRSDIESARNISTLLEKKYTDKGIADPKKRVLDIKEIVEVFKGEDFFFIPHADGHKNIKDAYKGSAITEAQRMVLLMHSALEKVTDAEITQHYNAGFSLLMSDEFKDRQDIAYIDFSDNHYCEKYPCKHIRENDAHLFYYIKGSKNYESLRLAFIDPESRIKSPTDYDCIDKTINYIESIKIEDIANSNLHSNVIKCSPHLNVIIGGRSSGKSLLMWLLGHKLDGVHPEVGKYKFSPDQISVKLHADDDYNSKATLNHLLLYLKQGDIINYFENNNLEELARNTTHTDEYNTSKREITDAKNILATNLRELCTAYKNVYDNCVLQNMFVIASSTINDALNESVVVRFNHTEISQQLQTIDIDANIELMNNTIDGLTRIKSLSNLDFSTEEKDDLNKVIRILTTKKEFLNRLKSSINKASNFVQLVNAKIRDINYTSDIDGIRKTRAEEHIRSIKDAVKIRLMLMRELRDASLQVSYENYGQKKIIQLNNDVSLVLEVENNYNISALLLDGILQSNGSESLYLNIAKLLSKRLTLKSYPNDNGAAVFEKKMKSQLEWVFRSFDTPTDYLEYSDGENSKGKSPGYNSEQYLKIILSNENFKTVFIDQPEDNLGNSFISKELAKLIRDIKFKKQIFLVTHNPSIVVYGDAECVILAENNENVIQYRQLVIEDMDAQKTICDTFDGGKYIFNNRAEKYNIKRLKN